jgi:DNA-binding response OmpR family regulator
VWLEQDLSLTPTETRIVEVLGYRLNQWVPAIAIVRAIYRETEPGLLAANRKTFRTHLWRIRRKLEPTPWRIENRYWHGLYRLIEKSRSSERLS